MDPHDARVAREAMYREMAGSDWQPSLPGDVVMPRCHEDDCFQAEGGDLLWPPIRDQLFYCGRGDAWRPACGLRG